jgi:hypothetical protein
VRRYLSGLFRHLPTILSKKEAVTAALHEYVQARKRLEILDWVGKVDYHDDYEPKRLRNRKPQ